MFEYLFEVINSTISEILGIQQANYWLGVVYAILSGICNNIGSVIQKKVVNERSDDSKFFRSLIKDPLWLVGLVLQLGIGSALFILAQAYIGPTLIPGLMASGLIFLAIGSIKIVREKLNLSEYLGIFIMIIATAFIGFSNMEINVAMIDFLQMSLIIRISIFTISMFVLSIILEIMQRKKISKGISLAVLSGIMFVLSNFWISPLMGVITHVFNGTAVLAETIIFVAAAILLIVTNIFGLSKIQEAFREGQAGNLIPIQQVPIQVALPFYYLTVFFLPLPDIYSLLFLIIGLGLVIVSTFLLARRQAQIEKIK